MFSNLSSKADGGAGPKREKKRASPGSALDEERARVRALRSKEIRKIDEIGPEPKATGGSVCFMQHNKDFYNVPLTHMLPCNLSPGAGVEAGDLLDSNETIRNRRRRFMINCGKPTPKNPDAGKVLHGTWTTNSDGELECTPWLSNLLDYEQYTRTFTDPMRQDKAGRNGVLPQPVADPSKIPNPKTDFKIGDTLTYSDADVAGRYVGHMALSTAKTAVWARFVLGCDIDYTTGKTKTADIPVLDGPEATTEENNRLWEEQKVKMTEAFSKLYLVYPVAVDPCIGVGGEVYPLGELAAAKLEGRRPKPVHETLTDDGQEAQYAPQPVQFVSLMNDRREGAPPGRNIAGFHDRTRAWPLPPGHVLQMRKILKHYDLEKAFPALANLHAKRNSAMLNLDALRQKEHEELGPPPFNPCTRDELVCKEWLGRRAAMPFGKVWVQKCSPEHPDGVLVFGRDTPLLVPLQKGRAEDLNGTPWLDVEDIDRSTPEGQKHYDEVQTMLHRVTGRAYNGSGGGGGGGKKRKAASSSSSSGDAVDVETGLLPDLVERGRVEAVAAEVSKLRANNEKLTTDLENARSEIKRLKMEKPHMILDPTRPPRGVVDFVPRHEAKCIVRWSSGKCLIDVGDGNTITAPGNTNTVMLHYLASEDTSDLPSFPMMLEDNSGGDHDEDM